MILARLCAVVLWIGSFIILAIYLLNQCPQNRPGPAIAYGVILWIAVDYYEMRLGVTGPNTKLFLNWQFVRTLMKMWTVILGAFFGLNLYDFSKPSTRELLGWSLIIGLGSLWLAELSVAPIASLDKLGEVTGSPPA